MLFLVTGENIDPGYLLPPEQTLTVIEQAVIPSFQMMAQWESEGRLKGGTYPAERGGALVIEADSLEELDRMINGLPFFPLVKWRVKPLVSMATTVKQVQANLQHVKNMMQQAGQGG